MEQKVGHNTITEILSEPATWKQCLDDLGRGRTLEEIDKKLPGKCEYVFVGCGSSFYLAQVAAATLSLLTGGNARALPASEILLFPKLFPTPCQPILISRSGFTSEILEAAKYLEWQLNVRTLAITCGSRTPLEKIATHTVSLPAADEKSTVMTRSFTSMLVALQSLAAVRAGDQEFLKGLRALPAKTQELIPRVNATVRALVDARAFADYVFLGQGPFHGIAQEAMLKVTEMSCSYAQCFHTLEFRHGPKSIVSAETLVTFFLSESGFDAETSVLAEVKELGGATLVITNRANPAVRRAADYLLELSLDVPEAARAAAAVIPGQLLGFYTGIRKGLDPDQPRNLSRVVMLERDNQAGGVPRATT
jgi:glutamine---fructose-6-phosphate transaminase (isomerizing)